MTAALTPIISRQGCFKIARKPNAPLRTMIRHRGYPIARDMRGRQLGHPSSRRTPGPIASVIRDVEAMAACGSNSLERSGPVVMAPGVRREDASLNPARRRERACRPAGGDVDVADVDAGKG